MKSTGAILYVDDDPANLLVFEALCDGRFEVFTTQSGASALEVLERHQIAVLLADQRMPEMTGVELAERVCRDYPEVVRILITAYSDLGEAIEAINRGQIRSYLRKPWDQDELLATLKEAVETFEMREHVRDLQRHMLATERVYALGVVTAGVAHELRGPLCVVDSTCKLMIDQLENVRSMLEAGDAASSLRALEGVLANLNSQRETTQAMAEICRGLELGSQPATSDESCDLREVVRLAARTARASFRERGRLYLEVGDPICVRGSRNKLGQVVLNLMVNAFQSLGVSADDSAEWSQKRTREGEVRVLLYRRADDAVLEVQDNGSGISARDRNKIFDPFYTTKPVGGTGLGLAISKAIVEELDGMLECESEPQVGSVFRMKVPARDCAAESD